MADKPEYITEDFWDQEWKRIVDHFNRLAGGLRFPRAKYLVGENNYTRRFVKIRTPLFSMHRDAVLDFIDHMLPTCERSIIEGRYFTPERPLPKHPDPERTDLVLSGLIEATWDLFTKSYHRTHTLDAFFQEVAENWPYHEMTTPDIIYRSFPIVCKSITAMDLVLDMVYARARFIEAKPDYEGDLCRTARQIDFMLDWLSGDEDADTNGPIRVELMHIESRVGGADSRPPAFFRQVTETPTFADFLRAGWHHNWLKGGTRYWGAKKFGGDGWQMPDENVVRPRAQYPQERHDRRAQYKQRDPKLVGKHRLAICRGDYFDFCGDDTKPVFFDYFPASPIWTDEYDKWDHPETPEQYALRMEMEGVGAGSAEDRSPRTELKDELGNGG